MDQLIFKKRRKEFLRRIAELDGGLVILEAAAQAQRNHDVEHEFRQDSNFYYLTGLESPGVTAVFDPTSKKPYTLFVHARDPKKEVWIGSSVGPEEAVKYYGADRAFEIEKLSPYGGSPEGREIENYLSASDTLWHHARSHSAISAIISAAIEDLRQNPRSGKHAPNTIRDPLPLIAEMRLTKSNNEISSIQKAVDMTAHGFRQCFEVLKPGLKQYQLRAEFEHAIRWRGVARHAYPPIITSGAGTCVLHNPHDRSVIQKNSLVLIDAGAEWDYYAADITRTVPASGTFTKQQRTIYEIVLEAQERAIAMVKPGAVWQALEDAAREFMTKRLIKQKIVSPERSKSKSRGERPAIRSSPGASEGWFPHKLGHWLGLDVHDVGSYVDPSLRGAAATKQSTPYSGLPRPIGARNDKSTKNKLQSTILNRKFEPGMVLTIEPGIYLRPSKEIAREYWNIGIRIEDNILVTRTGSKNLSQAIPKDPDVLERIIQKAQRANH